MFGGKDGLRARIRVEDPGGGVGRAHYRIDGVPVARGRQGDGSKPLTLAPETHRVGIKALDGESRLASPWEGRDLEIAE